MEQSSEPKLYNTFEYESLEHPSDQIRLLTLEPNPVEEAEVHCTLRTVSFNSDLQYEALSYAWGTSLEKSIVYINGKTFKVTTNLKAALVSIRRTSSFRTLWIDAICINQESQEEKTHQVREMRRIYYHAKPVLIWLGPSTPELDRLMTGLTYIFQAGWGAWAKEWFEDEEVQEWVWTLLKKPWWNRLWVVQEAVVGGNQTCVGWGDKWLLWDNLRAALAMVVRLKAEAKQGSFHNLVSVMRLLKTCKDFKTKEPGEREFVLSSLLEIGNLRATSDPKDKIIALLSLAKDTTVKANLADYNQSVEDLYQKVMVAVFREDDSLTFLPYASTGQILKPLPSWCVDFSRVGWMNHTRAEPWLLQFQPGEPFRASGNLRQPRITHDLKSGSLDLSGVVVGSVREGTLLSSPSDNDKATSEAVADNNPTDPLTPFKILTFEVCALHALASRLGERKASELVVAGEVWKIMTNGWKLDEFSFQIDDDIDRNGPSNYATLKEWADLFLGSSESPTDDPKIGIPNTSRSSRLKWILEMCKKFESYTLFTTDTGFIGRADSPIQAEDLVCILYGCPFPAVLRQECHRFRLVTFALVQDVMYGELVGDQALSRQTRHFVLC